MKAIQSIVVAAFACACASSVEPPAVHTVHWDYGDEAGPDNWGQLAAEFSECAAGEEQSPVNLPHSNATPTPAPVINWSRARRAEIVNNGHTLQVNVQNAGHLWLDDKRYRLAQFHFHHNSEHTIGGVRFPMEAHFVHVAEDGELAVLGVMIVAGEENPTLTRLWNVAPSREGQAQLENAIDPRLFLPSNRSALRYEGSLTTPPCSEGVKWVVLRRPITANAQQIAAFAWLYPNNARPLQPLGERTVAAAE